MVSLYSLITGFGSLYMLPGEIRKQIFKEYFSSRTITQKKQAFELGYSRNLLLVSKAIKAEAASLEIRPGIVFEASGTAGCPASTKLRKVMLELDITQVPSLDTTAWMDFNAAEFPALRTIRTMPRSQVTDGLTFYPSETINDALHGRLDRDLIAHIRSMNALHGEAMRSFDWDKIPASVTLHLEWKMSFISIHGSGENKTIVSDDISS